MHDSIEAYIDSEEEALKASSDDEDNVEPSIAEAQEKYNQLQERYITLKTMTESLKEKISLEREQLSKEVKATVEMQTEMRKRSIHVCGDSFAMNAEEYRRRIELFKDFILFRDATEKLENITKKKNYELWITEVEYKCNLELLKLKENMMILKPLQDIASRWGKENQEERTCASGASGDKVDGDAETVPVKETEELEIDEN